MNPRAALTILVRFSRTVTFQLHHIFRHSATARHNRYLLLSLGLLVTVTLSAQQLFHHQEEFARSRLFETSAQDLLLQSMVLRHLQTDNSQIGQIRIASRGYKSTAELLHQVSSRLAILEASSPNANLSKILLDLRIQWVLMKTRLKSHPELPVQFSHNWWKALEDLNRKASAAKRDSGQAVINLQRYAQGLLILVMTSLTLASIY
ncbi:MAG TPA: hypothetical protein VFV28_08885, partial [Limnobacter sp.]|nr:hypothetical protein [Limnobacter sp.]